MVVSFGVFAGNIVSEIIRVFVGKSGTDVPVEVNIGTLRGIQNLEPAKAKIEIMTNKKIPVIHRRLDIFGL